jgi:hypothetical protein
MFYYQNTRVRSSIFYKPESGLLFAVCGVRGVNQYEYRIKVTGHLKPDIKEPPSG